MLMLDAGSARFEVWVRVWVWVLAFVFVVLG
jgi:hypothetical protein